MKWWGSSWTDTVQDFCALAALATLSAGTADRQSRQAHKADLEEQVGVHVL